MRADHPPRPSSGTRAPHLLYIAWGYPPSRGGGVYRALATPNEFARAGWDVTVLTADEATFERFTGSDRSLLAHIEPSVQVERVPFSWPALDTDISSYSALRVYAPKLWRRLRRRLDTTDFPEVGYGPWRRPLRKRALEIHRRHPVDLTIATANPNVAFAGAHDLFRASGVPFVMDYRDAWTLNTFEGGAVHALDSRVGRLESRLLQDATDVWFVNDAIRGWHAERYPAAADKMHVVANGWDPEFTPVDPDASPARRESTEAPVFGYLGTLTPTVPLVEMLEGWRLARSTEPRMDGARLELHGYLGYYATPRPDMSAEVARQADVGVSYEGPVGKADVARTYDSFDVLVLAVGGGKYVTSGKVFEYAATGKPIVSVHAPDMAAREVLSDYPLWFPVTEVTAEGVADAFARAARALETVTDDDVARCRQVAMRFRRDHQLGPRISELSALVGQPAAAVTGGTRT